MLSAQIAGVHARIDDVHARIDDVHARIDDVHADLTARIDRIETSLAEVVVPDFENLNDPAPSAELPGSATTRRTHKRQLLRRRPPR